MRNLAMIWFALAIWSVGGPAMAQDLTIATVTRPPFSMIVDGAETGFSIDLMNAVAKELDLTVSYNRMDSFAAMLDAVQAGQVDGAIANISITASRETVMDFTQPIFDSGIQVMMPATGGGSFSIISALLTREIGLAIFGALVLLFGGGMLMWLFERGKQSYFDRPAREAAFPAFWWALNLVVNGGSEERVPTSRAGRVFSVMLVISSLFIVSIFVAQITAALTVHAIQDNVDNIADVDGRRVATVSGSTSATYLNERGIGHLTFDDLDGLIAAFEADDLDAVVFDGPILAYYVRTNGAGKARLLDRVYRPENYGMVFPTGSPLREEIDRSMLRLREDGTYDLLLMKRFGPTYSRG